MKRAALRLRRAIHKIFVVADRSVSVRLGGLLVVFIAVASWVFYLTEGGQTTEGYASVGEASQDVLILAFSGFDTAHRPTTMPGRVAAMSVLLLGIIFVTLLIGDSASYLVRRALDKNKGLGDVKVKNHTLVCNWNEHSLAIIEQLQLDESHRDGQIVVVADLKEHPCPQLDVAFISGSPTRDDVLQRASIHTAKNAIVTGNDGDSVSSDSVAILTALAIEASNSHVYTSVLVFDSSSPQHLTHANVDEIVCVSDMTTRVLAQSAINHGLSQVLSDLLAFDSGCEIYKVALPDQVHGMDFHSAAAHLLQEHGASLLAVERARAAAPRLLARSEKVTDGDCGFVVAEDLPAGLVAAL